MDYSKDWLSRQSVKLRDHTFIIGSGFKFNFSEFQLLVEACANYFSSKGIKKRDNAALLSDDSIEIIISVFALWKLKAVPVLLNMRLLESELKQQMNFTDCRHAIQQDELSEKFSDNDINKVVLPKISNLKPARFVRESDLDLNSTALILFTSGSTSTPKAVELSFSNLLQSTLIGNQVLQQSNYDKWLLSLPLYHIGGFSIIVRALLFGSSIIIPKSIKTEDLLSAIHEHKPSLASFVSTQMKRIIQAMDKPNPELRHVLLGGGFISDEIIHLAVTNGWKVNKVYGSTETCAFVTNLSFNELPAKIKSVGKPLHPNRILIFDSQKNILPENKSGEIGIISPAVMKGYYNNTAMTNEKLVDGVYFTGDYGYLDDEGYLFVEMRRGDLIVSGGENINPNEIENILGTCPGIKETYVFGVDDAEWGQVVSAAVAAEPEINHKTIKKFLAGKLPGFKHPRKIYFISELPKTPLGKVNKKKLFQSLGLKTGELI